MPDSYRSRLVDALKNLTLGLERAAAEEAASGAVQGASEGLRRELDGASGQAREWFDRLATDAARTALESARDPDGLPATAARLLAGSAARGAIDELERQWAHGALPMKGLVERLDRLLDDVTRLTAAWEHDRLDPTDRARKMATETVRAAVAELRGTLLSATHGPAPARAARELGLALGAGFAEGLATGMKPHLRDLAESAAEGAADGLLSTTRRRVPAAARAGARGAAAALEGTVSALSRGIATMPITFGLLVVAAVLAGNRR
jgi:hypothetical protein